MSCIGHSKTNRQTQLILSIMKLNLNTRTHILNNQLKN